MTTQRYAIKLGGQTLAYATIRRAVKYMAANPAATIRKARGI